MQLGVFALCIVGELCAGKASNFDADSDLRAMDVQLCQDDFGDWYVDVTIKSSKTDIRLSARDRVASVCDR